MGKHYYLDQKSRSENPENGGRVYGRNHHAQFGEDRRAIVTTIFGMMARDYGTAFSRQFDPAKGELAANVYDWKCTLLDFSKPYTDEILINAVDNVCRLSPEFPPTLRLIQGEMDRLRKGAFIAERNAATLAKAREPVNVDGQKRIAEEMSGMSEKMAIRDRHEVSLEDLLDHVLAYECAMFTVSPDKSMPRTRNLCALLAAESADGKTAPEFACDSAFRQGGEVLSMFRQIIAFQTQ